MSLISEYVKESKDEMPMLQESSGEDNFLQASLEWYVRYSQWLEVIVLNQKLTKPQKPKGEWTKDDWITFYNQVKYLFE